MTCRLQNMKGWDQAGGRGNSGLDHSLSASAENPLAAKPSWSASSFFPFPFLCFAPVLGILAQDWLAAGVAAGRGAALPAPAPVVVGLPLAGLLLMGRPFSSAILRLQGAGEVCSPKPACFLLEHVLTLLDLLETSGMPGK